MLPAIERYQLTLYKNLNFHSNAPFIHSKSIQNITFIIILIHTQVSLLCDIEPSKTTNTMLLTVLENRQVNKRKKYYEFGWKLPNVHEFQIDRGKTNKLNFTSLI